MKNVVEGEPFTFECGGKELAKVLYYFGYIPDVSSSEYKIVCPFHNDLNPSMIVDIEKGNFFCFGCGVSGDAYNFVDNVYKKENGLQSLLRFFKILKSDKVEAIKFNHRIKTKKQSQELYDVAHDYYYGLSSVDWQSENTFEVKGSRMYMTKRGFEPKTLNYINAKITYNKSYPIIFPMLDNGEFKGWVCRTTLPDIEKKRKYLYNEGFLRRTTVVGNYGSKNYVFIVEGYMDRLKFVQYGEDNVIAILGWKMSKEQENKLKSKKITHVISALDNDPCGEKGTDYLKMIFKKVTRFCYETGVKDPGEMTKESFKRMYKKTMVAFNKDKKQ